MFTNEYQNLCIENAEKLRELWEPKFGDWVLATDWQVLGSRVCGKEEQRLWVVVHVWESSRGGGMAVYARSKAYPPTIQKPVAIWLPTPRQLWGMLEERGYDWSMGSGEGRYSIGLYLRTEMEYIGTWDGPDPETALLRCLMEVMKERGTDK